MNIIDLDSWDDFRSQVFRLETQCAALSEGKPWRAVSRVVYRGQANSEWALETTLERFVGPNSTMLSYYGAVSAILPYLQSFTGKTWSMPSREDLEAEVSDLDGFGLRPPAYDVLVHLRHHGFPSPLLDWSRSPFVAAFFALRAIPPAASRVAIFAYLEFAGEGKVGTSSEATITSLGPYVTTHPRHFLQQAEYTVCVSRPRNDPVFASHEAVFERGRQTQDLIWKFTIPVTDAEKARRELRRYNISAHSLFGSEEALLETLADQELRSRIRFKS